MGLRAAASALGSRIPKKNDSNEAKAVLAMAPALTEPISHRQSKISSPAQASSPRPLIGEETVTHQTQATTTSNSLHHHSVGTANAQTNGDVGSVDSYLAATKEIINSSAIQAVQQQLQEQKKFSDTNQTELQSIFAQNQIASNGPSLGPLFATHMDQQNIDQTIVSTDFHEQQQSSQSSDTSSLLNSIVNNSDIVKNTVDSIINENTFGAQVNQIDCSNLNAIETTAEELLAHQQSQFQQHFEQQFLQQQTQQADQSQLDQFGDLQQHVLQQQQQQQHAQNHQIAQFHQNEPTISNEQVMHQEALQQQQQPPIDLLALPNENAMQSQQSQSSGPTNSQMSNNFFKAGTEIDQILGDLSTTDIDLMQVLKCFESTPAGENLGDLAGGLSLFNDVDVMNMGLDDVVTNSSQSKESHTKETLLEIEKKREKMIRECDFMMRRLRKIQARHMARHISEEIGGVFEYAQQMIKRKERETKSISTMTPINQLHSDKQKLNSVSSWKLLMKRIEHAATNQQASSSSSRIFGTSTNSPSSDHHANNFPVSGSSALGSKPSIATCVPPFDVNGTQQIKQCAGLLKSELKLVGDGFDSEATASSSGGESADEGVSYNNSTQQTLSISKRAAYRWARDRAKIASRWSWLLSQISDLEYRIRQHQELYQLLKKSNGQVAFEDDEPVAGSHQTSTPSDAIQTPHHQSVNGYRGILPGNIASGDMKMYGNNEEIELNGSARTRAFKASSFKKRKLLQSTNLHKISRRAARPCTIKCGCRWPVHPCLLCTGRQDPTAPRDLPDMMSTAESVALLDPCYHPILSFPEDVAQNIHMESTLRQPEWQTKVARTSSKAIIKGALALQKANERDDNRNTVNSVAGSRKNSDATVTTVNSKKLSSKKYNKLVSTKLKKSRNNNNNNTSRKMKKSASLSHPTKTKKNKSRKNSHLSAASSDIHDMDVASPNGSLSRSINPSPTPAIASHHYRYERLHSERRHNKNAYDIDNIVIPSNMSTSRVEILSYKEIPTPKWRLIEDDDGKTENTSQEEDFQAPIAPKESTEEPMPMEISSGADEEEDISNEAISHRHERMLADERKKFSTFLKFPYSTRSRANRRIDSQSAADSSGANTPDPTSPAPSTPATATNIDQESAPPTPQSVDATNEATHEAGQFPQPHGRLNNNNTQITGASNGHSHVGPPVTLPKTERRRTVSFRKGMDPREELLRRSTTPDIKETIPPYEPLVFPLPNDTIEEMIQLMPTSYKNIINECIDQVTEDTKKSETSVSDAPTTSGSDQSVPATTTPITTLALNCKTQIRTEQYSQLTMLAEDSDETESIQEEDPNDPEWFEPPQRIPRLQ